MIEDLREKCVICDLYAQYLSRIKTLPRNRFQAWPLYAINGQALNDGPVQFMYDDQRYAEIMEFHGVKPSMETAKAFKHVADAHCLPPHEDEPQIEFGQAPEGAPVE